MDGRTLERRYDQLRQQADHLRSRCRHLEAELNVWRPEAYRASVRIDRLQQRNRELFDENRLLKRRVTELTTKLKQHQAQARGGATVVREGQRLTEEGGQART